MQYIKPCEPYLNLFTYSCKYMCEYLCYLLFNLLLSAFVRPDSTFPKGGLIGLRQLYRALRDFHVHQGHRRKGLEELTCPSPLLCHNGPLSQSLDSLEI